MNTSLKSLALFFAVSLPSAVAAEIARLPVPAALDATHLFGGFVVTLVLLTVFGDYGRHRPLRVTDAAVAELAQRKASHPLAA